MRKKCEHCHDGIRGKKVKLKIGKVVTFVIDQGCALLLDARGILDIQGDNYQIKQEI